ncbi:MAG: sugar ABC transporter permease [Caldilineae bacterium]|nr:MAG: sugar ABC transporter permease [Caldilineae bacterium]
METTTELEERTGILGWFTSLVGRILISIFVPAVTFVVLWQGFIFLRDSEAPKWIVAIVAIVWGVGGVALLYLVSNWLIERLSPVWVRRLQPFVFVGPAIAILTWYLALPTVRTFWFSLFNADSTQFVGLQNYVAIFTDRSMFIAFRNNLLWIVFGASLSVVFGLLIAVLADRSRFENIAKSLIFMPMAISMVGAGVIWNFIYEVKQKGDPQIGLLNAIWVAMGGDPQAWTALNQPWNNLFLIVIVIWLQTGFAMVLFSAAIKGIPAELLEAARVDGANEIQIFFKIMIPYIMGTIITVTTTIVIFTLKIFDVVWVMTGGQFGTHVIATKFYREYFTNRNFGFGSAIAIILLIAVIPVMIYNLKQFSEREAFR